MSFKKMAGNNYTTYLNSSNHKKRIINQILTNKKKLEKTLNAEFKIIKSNIEIAGNEFDIYIAEKIISALERNFSIDEALLLVNEEYVLEDLPIKNFTRRHDLSRIKARIIGTRGKTLKILGELSDSHLVLNDNIVSIISPAEKIKIATNAVLELIQGNKQGHVYSYLEKQRKNAFPELKIKK